jgi:hypothetical protein
MIRAGLSKKAMENTSPKMTNMKSEKKLRGSMLRPSNLKYQSKSTGALVMALK